MRIINKIIVHSSATHEGKDFQPADIEKWHLERGFKEIGYHYVITLDGVIHTGRKITKAGAHCLGQNATSIGICYIGGVSSKYLKPKNTMTPEQEQSLYNFINMLKEKYNIADSEIYGHKDFAKTACPSFDVKRWYNIFQKKVNNVTE